MANEHPAPTQKATDCLICADGFDTSDLFQCPVCRQQFCLKCMNKLIESRMELSDDIEVKCVACYFVFDAPMIVKLLDPKAILFDNIVARMYSAQFHENIRYCSNPRCSNPFDWVTNKILPCGSNEIAMVSCPLCEEKTCANCRSPWHDGLTCDDDILRREETERLPKLRNCPSCGHLIERLTGCNTMTCRCGCHFCIACGLKRCGGSCFNPSIFHVGNEAHSGPDESRRLVSIAAPVKSRMHPSLWRDNEILIRPRYQESIFTRLDGASASAATGMGNSNASGRIHDLAPGQGAGLLLTNVSRPDIFSANEMQKTSKPHKRTKASHSEQNDGDDESNLVLSRKKKTTCLSDPTSSGQGAIASSPNETTPGHSSAHVAQKKAESGRQTTASDSDGNSTDHVSNIVEPLQRRMDGIDESIDDDVMGLRSRESSSSSRRGRQARFRWLVRFLCWRR